jgi:hypothetical protein
MVPKITVMVSVSKVHFLRVNVVVFESNNHSVG